MHDQAVRSAGILERLLIRPWRPHYAKRIIVIAGSVELQIELRLGRQTVAVLHRG